MKWRHWAILIILVLLNYIIFSTAFTQLAEQRRPQPRPTRTPQPTFESFEPSVISWVIVPTSTPYPTKTPITPSPTTPISVTTGISVTVPVTRMADAAPTAISNPMDTPTAQAPATATSPPQPTATPVPPTPEPESVTHIVKSGETLSDIAALYNVSVQAIIEANGLADADRLAIGQELLIPTSGQAPPAATTTPQPTQPPTPRPTSRPTTKPAPTQAPPTPTKAIAAFQYTAQLIWDPWVAPNCSGPAIAKQSIIQDKAGNPVDGVVVMIDCYGNLMLSHASGTPGEYDPGHYDWAPGQDSPQDWTCTARVDTHNGQPVESSEVATIVFDTNDCDPEGSGHQVAILNWIKNW